MPKPKKSIVGTKRESMKPETAAPVQEKAKVVFEEAKKVEIDKPDFRGLADPEKTLRRIAWVSGKKEMTHGEKSVAVAFLLAFEGQPDRQILNLSSFLNKETGYSPIVIRAMLERLEGWGLLERRLIRKQGSEITLKF